MHEVPPLPDVADAPDVLSGHIWLQELVDGTPLRFQVRDSAPIHFGDEQRVFDAKDAPRALQHAIHEIQRRLDRAALRQAVDDVGTITFVGIGTHRRRLDYDWRRLPGFLGTDIWDANAGEPEEAGEWLPPDRAEQVFMSLGLDPVNAIEKEVRAADFQPSRYEFPESDWRDGPVAGVVVRNKTGGRARLDNPGVRGADAVATLELDHESTPAERAERLADESATDTLFERTADVIRADKARSLTFDSLQQAIIDASYREHAPAFEQYSVDHDALRRAVSRKTSEFIGTRT